MRNPAYLSLSRHNIYYFRYPLPSHLHPTGRKVDIRLSLQTRCPNEALRAMRNLVYLTESILKHPTIAHMEYTEIRAALHAHFKAERERVKQRISKLGQLQAHEVANYQSGQDRTTQAIAIGDYADVSSDENLAPLIDTNKWDIDKDSPAYELLRAEHAKAFRDYCESVLEYNSRFDSYHFRSDPAFRSIQERTHESQKVKLTECIDTYIAEKIRYKTCTEVSAKGFRAQLDLMAEYLGSKASIHVSKDTALDVRRMLEDIPQRARSLPKYKAKSLQELMELKDVEGLSPESINKYLRTITAFYEWAVKMNYTTENNFKGLVARLRNKEQPRDPFTDAQIKIMTDAILNNPKKFIRKEYQKWGTLIALYTGARLKEIGQLAVEDVLLIDGVWCFSINCEDDKELKNTHSKRKVPIHSRLLELGILELVERNRKAGKARLLHELTNADEKNGYGRNLGRWFNEKFLVKLGMKTTRLVFHSFRHTVISRLQQADIDDPIVKTLCGHSQGKNITQSVYGKGYKISQLQNAIEKVVYPV